MDASNMLKPALARGDLRCVGATTLDEYRKYIEKDAALARRFQPVLVEEPGLEDTVSILRGLKERYEVHHGVRISDQAIVAAATLANRYLQHRKVRAAVALARLYCCCWSRHPTAAALVWLCLHGRCAGSLHPCIATVEGILFVDLCAVHCSYIGTSVYISLNQMPDKAVDLMDEAASSLRLQQESKPDAIEALDRRIISRRIEVEALRRETDKASVERRKALEAEIEHKEAEMGALMDKWKAEKAALEDIKGAKEKLETAKRDLLLAEVWRIGRKARCRA